MEVPYFLKKEGNQAIYNYPGTLIFFVPEEHFSKELAIISGEDVSLFGLFNYAIYDENGKVKVPLKEFNFPTIFLSRPSDMETKKDVKLTKETPVQDYRLLKFTKGDIVVVSTKVPQMMDNVEEFFKLCLYGKIPNTVPYDKFHEYPLKSMELAGNSFGINNQMFGIYASEAFRSKDDKSVPFRLSGETNMNNYYMAPIKDIPKYVTAYTSIVSENWDDSVVAATLNKNKREIPLEKIMMM